MTNEELIRGMFKEFAWLLVCVCIIVMYAFVDYTCIPSGDNSLLSIILKIAMTIGNGIGFICLYAEAADIRAKYKLLIEKDSKKHKTTKK